MAKPFKNLNEQIEYLQKNKSIVFNDIEKAKKYLLDSNYFNVISCSKVKFAEKIENGCHIYSLHDFEEWKTYFEQDCYVSESIMLNMIEFERTLNSRVSYQISMLFADGSLNASERNALVLKIRNSKVYKAQKFYGKEAWKYITKMTFGETKSLLFWLKENKKELYKDIVADYPFLSSNVKRRLDDLNYLRNALFHFTPLNIFLSYAYRKNGKIDNRSRKEAVEFAFSLLPNQRARIFLDEILQNSDRFTVIKNSQRKR
ncbi:MAG: hypothetical protein LBV19_03185 [Streptococcaceae bacterium]|jgi:hypothetical protein|nr:hypothetical protein [Streptococcaceae bacterium]